MNVQAVQAMVCALLAGAVGVAGCLDQAARHPAATGSPAATSHDGLQPTTSSAPTEEACPWTSWNLVWHEPGLFGRAGAAGFAAVAAAPGIPLRPGNVTDRFGPTNVTQVDDSDLTLRLVGDHVIAGRFVYEIDNATMRQRFEEFAREVLDASDAEIAALAERFIANRTDQDAWVAVDGPYRVDALAASFEPRDGNGVAVLTLWLNGTVYHGENWWMAASVPTLQGQGFTVNRDDHVSYTGPGANATVVQDEARRDFHQLSWPPPSFGSLQVSLVGTC